MIRRLTLQDAEYIAHRLAIELMNTEDEPIPPFDTREKGKLESCLAEPFQTFDGVYLHRTFIDRAAVMFYLIIKNHCFANGNKRMAVTLTIVFCYLNNWRTHFTTQQLYDIACYVAESKPDNKDLVINEIKKLFKIGIKKKSVRS